MSDAVAEHLGVDAEVHGHTPAGGNPIAFSNNANGDRTTGLAPDQTSMSYTYDQADRLTKATGHGASTAAGLIAAGEYHSLAVDDTGTVWAGGDNTYGQLGDGTTAGHTSPVKVTGLTGSTQIAPATTTSSRCARTAPRSTNFRWCGDVGWSSWRGSVRR